MSLSATEARKEFSRALTRVLRQGRFPVRACGAGTWDIGPKEGLVVSPDGEAASIQFKTRFRGWTRLHRNENPNNVDVGQGEMLCDFSVGGCGGGGQSVPVGELPCPEVLAPLFELEDSIVERIARKAGLEYVASIQAKENPTRSFLMLDRGITRAWKRGNPINYFYWESAEDLITWGEAIGRSFDGLIGALARHLKAEADDSEARGGPSPPSAKGLSDGTREAILRMKRAAVVRSRALSIALEEMLGSSRRS